MAVPGTGWLRTQEEEMTGGCGMMDGWMDGFSNKVSITGRRFETASLKTAHQINVVNNEIYVYD